MSKSKLCQLLTVFIAVLIILYFTVFTRDIGAMRIFKGPFWELQNGMWRDIVLNMFLFVPFGIACGSILRWKSVCIGLMVSVAIETVQYIGALGYTEVDDVINNTIGTVIGVTIWVTIGRSLNDQ